MSNLDIYIDNFHFNISKKNNIIQISIFNDDKIFNSTVTNFKYDINNNVTSIKNNIIKDNNIKNNKILFFRQKIFKTTPKLLKFADEEDIDAKYYLKNVFYEFNKLITGSFDCVINEFESNFVNLKIIETLINKIKKNIECEYCFFLIYDDGSGNSDQIRFKFDTKKYHFLIEQPCWDDASFYSIKINYNDINKNKIIKFFEKYYQLISSI